MNCLECRNLLQRRLDGESILDGELETHLRGCAECRGWQGSSVRLLEGVRRLPQSGPPLGFSQRLTGLVLRDRERRRRRFRWFLAGGAIAASILLIVVVNHNRRLEPDDRKSDQGIANKNPAIPPKDAPGLNPTLDEVRFAVASLTDRVAKGTKENTQLLVSAVNPMETTPTAKTQDSGLNSYVKTVSGAGQGVSEAVQPVMQSGQRAVNYFFKGLPPAKLKTPPK